MKSPVKAGREQRMKEPYKKGVANHLDPGSCADAGNRVGEALPVRQAGLTGAHAGRPSSSEITSPNSKDVILISGLVIEGRGKRPRTRPVLPAARRALLMARMDCSAGLAFSA